MKHRDNILKWGAVILAGHTALNVFGLAVDGVPPGGFWAGYFRTLGFVACVAAFIGLVIAWAYTSDRIDKSGRPIAAGLFAMLSPYAFLFVLGIALVYFTT